MVLLMPLGSGMAGLELERMAGLEVWAEDRAEQLLISYI